METTRTAAQTGQTSEIRTETPTERFEVPGIPADYVAIAVLAYCAGHAMALRSVRASQRPTIVRNP